MSAIKNILVPTDFSEASKAALQYACQLADVLGASLSILHTVQAPYPASAYTEYHSLPQEFVERLEQEAMHGLGTALSADAQAKYRVRLVLRRGAAAPEILAYLAEHDEVGLVVMATHGRGGVARLMMGSVTDRIVRSAPCPVLTLRVPDVEEAHGGRAA